MKRYYEAVVPAIVRLYVFADSEEDAKERAMSELEKTYDADRPYRIFTFQVDDPGSIRVFEDE